MKTILQNATFLFLMGLTLSFAACEKDDFAPPPQSPTGPDVIQNPGSSNAVEFEALAAIDPLSFNSEVAGMLRNGMVPAFIDGFLHTAGNSTGQYETTLLNVVFQTAKPGVQTIALANLSGAQYQAAFDEHTANGFRPKQVESYRVKGKIRFAVIFTDESGPTWVARHGMLQSKFQDYFDQKVSEGYRMVNRSVVKVNGKSYVASLFDKKNVGGWVSKSGLDEAAIQEMMENKKAGGIQLAAYLDISQKSSSNFTYGPIFHSESHDNWYALNKLSQDQLADELDKAKDKGYQVTFLMGYDIPGLINGNEVHHLRFAVGFRK